METETISIDPVRAARMLAFLADAGADEILSESPVDRFAAVPAPNIQPPLPPAAKARSEAPAPLQPVRAAAAPAPVAPEAALLSARKLAAAARDLGALQAAMASFEGCGLRHTANALVFADGNPDARVMLIGEAPGSDEDRQGLPFVGRSGQLLDKMLAAIGLDRTSAYITNVIPWRPPGNRTPTAEEMAVCAPFLFRHIALAKPEVIVCLGATPAKHLLDIELGITRLRGHWKVYRHDGLEIDVLPTFHPAFLLRSPLSKKLAWADFLALKTRLRR
jgi:uracil-DNA glycosylase